MHIYTYILHTHMHVNAHLLLNLSQYIFEYLLFFRFFILSFRSSCLLFSLSLFFCLFFFWGFFGPCFAACGILVPWPGIEPMPPAVEAWSLNRWTPGKSLLFSFLCLFPHSFTFSTSLYTEFCELAYSSAFLFPFSSAEYNLLFDM